MRISFKAGTHNVTLRVPGPQGLIEPEPSEQEFVIKMMSKDFGLALYRELVDYATDKPPFFAEQMANGYANYDCLSSHSRLPQRAN